MKLKVMQTCKHTHTHTHTQNSTVVIIYAIIGSERDTVRGNTLNSQGYIIVLLASERDTYRGKNEKIGDVCLFVYMYGRTYVILYFDPRVFVLVMWSTPSQIALNTILWFIDQYPYHPRN